MEQIDEELELWNDACLLLDGMIREVSFMILSPSL